MNQEVKARKDPPGGSVEAGRQLLTVRGAQGRRGHSLGESEKDEGHRGEQEDVHPGQIGHGWQDRVQTEQECEPK